MPTLLTELEKVYLKFIYFKYWLFPSKNTRKLQEVSCVKSCFEEDTILG